MQEVTDGQTRFFLCPPHADRVRKLTEGSYHFYFPYLYYLLIFLNSFYFFVFLVFSRTAPLPWRPSYQWFNARMQYLHYLCTGDAAVFIGQTSLLHSKLEWSDLNIDNNYDDGLVQDCSISSANALEILQSCTKPLICLFSVLRSDHSSSLYSSEVWPVKTAASSVLTQWRYCSLALSHWYACCLCWGLTIPAHYTAVKSGHNSGP